MFGTYVGHHPYVKSGNKSRRDQNALIVGECRKALEER
jgi:hypothetical protein